MFLESSAGSYTIFWWSVIADFARTVVLQKRCLNARLSFCSTPAMSACRSVVLQKRCLDARVSKSSLAPWVDLLKTYSKPKIQKIMVDAMPIIIAPDLRKGKLIDQLVAFVLGSESLADVLAAVCTSALENLTVDMIHRLLRQWDPKSKWKRVRKPMIEHFIQLNMPQVDGNLHDDGPCLTIVPYVADCGAPMADCDAELVDYQTAVRLSRKREDRDMCQKRLKRAIKRRAKMRKENELQG